MDGKRLQRPGFGQPIYIDKSYPQSFRSAVLGWRPEPVTERERSMLAVINALTDKPDWEHKVFDDSIVARWRAEAVYEAPPLRTWTRKTFTTRQGFDDAMFDFCIAELRDKAAVYAEKRFVRILDTAAAVAKSDVIIPAGLRHELVQAVAELLEDVPESKKDWHPGSDGQVLDLVHPSLFPFVYGRSRILGDGRTLGLDDCLAAAGGGETVPRPWVEKVWGSMNNVCRYWDKPLWSNHFQWLPCDVAFTDEGKTRISSYVNNLHPVKQRALYSLIERVMDAALPLWEDILGYTGTDQEPSTYLRVLLDDSYYIYHDKQDDHQGDDGDGGDERKCEYEEDGKDEGDENEKDESDENEEDEGDEGEEDEGDENEEDEGDENEEDEDDEYSDEEEGKELDSDRELIFPSVQPYSHDDSKNVFMDVKANLREQFASQGLQVIVKLANICLTPDKPDYPGGSWHVEGMLNEWICATSIFYYDCDNVTDSYLGFRQNVNPEVLTEKAEGQNDYGGLEFLYSIKQCEASVQNVGRVLTREGRLLAFPNVLQHRVEPFSLQDRSRPGHRKILALFLVDPHQRIISTANVPPQRKDWWSEEILKEGVGKLPTELTELIVSSAEEWPMGMEEAKELRGKLMSERTANMVQVESAVFGQVSFCEH
ncbi:uncharacterized protein BKCO1_1320004 [Diplodia corticola]|uniref:Duf1665 domain containing protein n=1 Tax=Diplodia corticola TaxID=236234 RepID=A0A1J9QKP1_9PEZI|nr:uncharacterized protein BKCO1_1320004 [Diplodia corticola]OJD28634.1 hypothetical protein BKCO1_1320004 [Diplodia corticola]